MGSRLSRIKEVAKITKINKPRPPPPRNCKKIKRRDDTVHYYTIDNLSDSYVSLHTSHRPEGVLDSGGAGGSEGGNGCEVGGGGGSSCGGGCGGD